MRRSSAIFGLSSALGLLLITACFDDDDEPTAPSLNLDGGAGSEASSVPPPGPGTSDATADATKPVGPVTCGAPTEVDTAGGVVEVRATTFEPGGYVVSWSETSAVSGGLVDMKARIFRNGAFLPEQTLSNTGTAPAFLAADGQGQTYAAWLTGQGTFALATLAPAAATFGASTPASGNQQAYFLSALPSGAIFASVDGSKSPSATKFDPASGQWASSVVVPSNTFSTSLTSVATSSSGKAAFAWIEDDAVATLHLATSGDGASWTVSPASGATTLGGSGAETVGLAAGVYANGDTAIVYLPENATTAKLQATRHHASTSQLDVPATLDTAQTLGVPTVFIDASDRATVLYTKANELFAVRDVGAGWSTPLDLGAANDVVAAMDRNGNLAVVLQAGNQATSSTLRRLDATGTAWTDPVSTGLGTTGGSPSQSIAITFDATGAPVLFAKQIPASAPTTLQMVVCD